MCNKTEVQTWLIVDIENDAYRLRYCKHRQNIENADRNKTNQLVTSEVQLMIEAAL